MFSIPYIYVTTVQMEATEGFSDHSKNLCRSSITVLLHTAAYTPGLRFPFQVLNIQLTILQEQSPSSNRNVTSK